MDSGQREFLLVLAYLYVCYGKYDEALVLHRILKEFFEDDVEVVLGLCFSLYVTDRGLEAIQYLERLEGVEMDARNQKLYFLLRSHVDWGVGRDVDARNNLIHYLAIEEKEIRQQQASVGKEVEDLLP
jgi:hypothetical protein